MNHKLSYAIQLIKKYNNVMHVEKTGADHFVFLYEYVSGKKSINTNRIKKAVEIASKQQDYPKDVFYDQGMLFMKIESKTVKEVIESEPEIEVSDEILESVINETDAVILDAPKKRKSKKIVE